MRIIEAKQSDREKWNSFVQEHFPPVGAFFQTWQWGEFQQSLGYRITRCIVVDESGAWQGVFLLVHHTLSSRMRLSYGYMPRGPVVARAVVENTEKTTQFFDTIARHICLAYTTHLFVRMEPPLHVFPARLESNPFVRPSYYVQPRYNTVVRLEGEYEKKFSKELRRNLRLAKENALTIREVSLSDTETREHFLTIGKSTSTRAKKNVYPPELYFKNITKFLPADMKEATPTCRVFFGYHNNEPIAFHLTIYFGSTATYLFGGTRSDMLHTRISPLLNAHVMCDAYDRGYHYYDLGGIDKKLWPSLTHYKKQFSKEEISYIGNVDIVIKPVWYRLYNLLKKLR